MNKIVRMVFKTAVSAAASIGLGQAAMAQDVLPYGNWVNVCTAAAVQNGMMEAECENGRKQFIQSQLAFLQCRAAVTVSRGVLACDRVKSQAGPSMGWLPGGNWVSSCIGARNNNGIMEGVCYDGNGNAVASSLDLSYCSVNSVENINGQLDCP